MNNSISTLLEQHLFLLSNFQWAGIVSILFVGYFCKLILKKYMIFLLQRSFNKKKFQVSQKLIEKTSFSLSLIGFNLIWLLLIPFLKFSPKITEVLIILGRVGLNLGIILLAFYFTDIICHFFELKAAETDNKFDDIIVPLIRKTLKTFIILSGIIVLGDSLTLDVKSLIAGLGIGGIAFALAAKDTISNLFGSLTVLFDRPFHIGDWVVIDGKIEGEIEEVGLRSCKIRTFEDSLITLPNGKLTNADINNFGLRKYRRVTTKIGLEYNTTPQKIEQFCEQVKQFILTHDKTRKDNYYVYFNEMGDFSLSILISIFWCVNSKQEELQETHHFYLEILKIGQKLDVNFAFPTQTIHLSKES